MLLNVNQVDRFETETLNLLADVGLGVKNEEIAGLLQKQGCKYGANGRLRIPREVAMEVIGSQKLRTKKGKQEMITEDRVTDDSRPVLTDAFNPGPTRYFDFERGQSVELTPEIADNMLRLAEATPEIGGVHCWWPNTTEPEIESIVNLVRSLKLTRKVMGLDAIHPKQVKYLVEIGEIVTGESRSLRYLGGSQCMTPPLILGDRAAEEILERRDCGVPSYFVATMTMVGISSPITLPGAVVAGAAEILGGMVAAHTVCPEAEITGGAFVVCANLIGDKMTMTTPEMAWINAAIRELFQRRWGGHVITGTQYSPCTGLPGLQATYENYFMASAVNQLEGRPPMYAGKGLLANGSVGCPEQLILDIEARSAFRNLHKPVVLNKDSLALNVLREVISDEGRTFMDHEHTLQHWGERWIPRLFHWDQPSMSGSKRMGDEQHILSQAHQIWQENLSRYKAPDWPEETIRSLDDVEQRARRELLGTSR